MPGVHIECQREVELADGVPAHVGLWARTVHRRREKHGDLLQTTRKVLAWRYEGTLQECGSPGVAIGTTLILLLL